ncbi:MAG: 30S ribosomal protein S9 ['Candidatus Kapabacteria' thiocyanatum]|uniref:Small ribosomal subunit protein uS9 n=1 Tax=Candidatus Kapaibacterium thiocyanatum TaxID=1895771 RepID=A0A1M3KYN5_9BACT|nr:30S ribosomal protein S9 ['Candidatus Kapabacteria' thiocyanatum]OJX57628.1 MAG: 30S ribosomal protein S9 ['Candidatus Kapabacteria' thiocyanatum]
MKTYTGTGRRKTSVAQVRLVGGNGNVVVNKLPITEYFPIETYRRDAMLALEVAKVDGQFDVVVNVRGGGKAGQAGAVRLGVARALLEYSEELRAVLRPAGLLTRDPRMVERKKYGQKKARKRFQFSKR